MWRFQGGREASQRGRANHELGPPPRRLLHRDRLVGRAAQVTVRVTFTPALQLDAAALRIRRHRVIELIPAVTEDELRRRGIGDVNDPSSLGGELLPGGGLFHARAVEVRGYR